MQRAQSRERWRFPSTRLRTCVAQSPSNNVLATTADDSGVLLVKRRRPIGLLVRPDRVASDCRWRQHRLAHYLAHPLAHRFARALLIAPIGQQAERQAGQIGKRAKREQEPW